MAKVSRQLFVGDHSFTCGRADEIYVETKKDQVTAQNLLEEVETAKLYHPTARQSASFISRSEALLRRLSVRGNPASPTSTFPAEIAQATTLAQSADVVAKDYRKVYEDVKRVETLLQDMNDLAAQFVTIIERLISGVSNDEGDGSPPDLNSEACLEPTAHSVYLALLPDILEQATKANDSANRLKESRKIWTSMGTILTKLSEIRGFVEEAMEKNKWRQQTTPGGPLTPDSPPTSPVAAIPTHAELLIQLGLLAPKLSQDVENPFTVLSYTLEAPLKEWVSKSIVGLKNTFDAVKQLIEVLEAIQAQASAMHTIRDECNSIQVSIEDLKIGLKGSIDNVLAVRTTRDDITRTEESFLVETRVLEDKVQTFVQSLLHRVPFVDRRPLTPNINSTFVKRRYAALDPKAGLSQQGNSVELPFELVSLDDAVRADCNSYVINLSGKIESLLQLNAHLKLARMSKEVDDALKPLIDDISNINGSLNKQKARFASLGEVKKLDQLDTLTEELEQLSTVHRTKISRSLSFVRETVRRMQESPGAQDATVHESLLLSRVRAVDDVELRLNNWFEDLNAFKDQIASAHRQQSQRLEETRRADMQREQEEARRLAAEQSERARLEQERLVNEKLRKLEEEKLAGEERQRREKEKRAALDAEREILERQRREAEEQRRLEEQRLAEEKRAREDRLRQAVEEAEKARLHRERMEVEVRLKEVEGQLAEERRIAAERSERERIEAEEKERAARKTGDHQLREESRRPLQDKGRDHRRLDNDVEDFERGIDLSVIVEESNTSASFDEDDDEGKF